MALGKDKTAVPLTANIPADLRDELEIARVKRGRMKVQEAVADAIRQFVSTSTLADYDRSLLSEVIEMIQDSNGSYRASVADMVQAWRAGSKSTKKLAVAPKAAPKEKARRA